MLTLLWYYTVCHPRLISEGPTCHLFQYCNLGSSGWWGWFLSPSHSYLLFYPKLYIILSLIKQSGDVDWINIKRLRDEQELCEAVEDHIRTAAHYSVFLAPAKWCYPRFVIFLLQKSSLFSPVSHHVILLMVFLTEKMAGSIAACKGFLSSKKQ